MLDLVGRSQLTSPAYLVFFWYVLKLERTVAFFPCQLVDLFFLFFLTFSLSIILKFDGLRFLTHNSKVFIHKYDIPFQFFLVFDRVKSTVYHSKKSPQFIWNLILVFLDVSVMVQILEKWYFYIFLLQIVLIFSITYMMILWLHGWKDIYK